MSDDTSLLVACLCARWCTLCDDYRAVFDAARQPRDAGGLQFCWVDIEDEDTIVGPVEVDGFPTLLIADRQAPVFFGPLTPQPATLQRLLHSAAAGRLAPLVDQPIVDLVARVRAAADRLGGPRG